MAKKTKHNSAFDIAYQELKEKGLFKGVRDAKKPLTFLITEEHVKIAKRCDESRCAIAQGAGAALINDTVLSIGARISKVIDLESGWITRYATPKRLAKALDHYDQTGDWGLSPGNYSLMVPTGSTLLWENQPEELKKKAVERWKRFAQRFERGETNGSGITQPVHTSLFERQVTPIRVSARRKKGRKR